MTNTIDEVFRKLAKRPFEELWAERKRRMNEGGYNFDTLLKDMLWTEEEFDKARTDLFRQRVR
jgi:hypothetical protein